MKLDSLVASPEEIEAKLAEYQDELGDVDCVTRRIYEALDAGVHVIDYAAAILGPYRSYSEFPALAIARATAHQIVCVRRSSGFMTMRPQGWFSEPVISFQETDQQRPISRRSATAMVPTVPPALRPHNLKDHFILWEADWHQRPPRDPALLMPIVGSIAEVVATWDLTDIERAALGQAL